MRIEQKTPIYADLSYTVNGILFAVHNELGRFRNEKEYGDALEHRFKDKGIVYEREKVLSPAFEGEQAGRNKVDFLVDGKILLEIKSKRSIEKTDYYQVRRYLVALNKKLGLLVNFRDRYLKPKRILNSSVSE